LVVGDGDYAACASYCCELAGCHVDVADSLNGALNKLASQRYDIVVADIDGFGPRPGPAVARLRQAAGCPVIGLASGGRLRETGGYRELAKPIVPWDLVGAILVDLLLGRHETGLTLPPPAGTALARALRQPQRAG
jgi:DNA-binding response OmpR family regulator